MTWNELKGRTKAEYDSRNLKSDVRYKALNKIETFLLEKYNNVKKDVRTALPSDKKKLKQAYEEYAGKNINSAESSVINEIYNQMLKEGGI